MLEVGERQAFGVGDRTQRRSGSGDSPAVPPARDAPSRARRTRLWSRTSSSRQILLARVGEGSEARECPAMDAALAAYLEELVRVVRTALGKEVVAVALIGGAGAGAFEPGASDVDVAVVIERALPAEPLPVAGGGAVAPAAARPGAASGARGLHTRGARGGRVRAQPQHRVRHRARRAGSRRDRVVLVRARSCDRAGSEHARCSGRRWRTLAPLPPLSRLRDAVLASLDWFRGRRARQSGHFAQRSSLLALGGDGRVVDQGRGGRMGPSSVERTTGWSQEALGLAPRGAAVRFGARAGEGACRRERGRRSRRSRPSRVALLRARGSGGRGRGARALPRRRGSPRAGSPRRRPA